MSPRADYNKTLDSIRKIETENPGISHDVQTYLRERIDEVLAGSTEAVVVRIFGPNLIVLRREAALITNKLEGVPGLVDLHPDPNQDVPQIQVTVKLPVARRYGLKPGDVRRAAATMIAGEEVGDIFREGKVYGVAVWSTPQTRRNTTDIERLPIDVPHGGRDYQRGLCSILLLLCVYVHTLLAINRCSSPS